MMWCLAIVLFFSREVLGKRWGLSTSRGASPWVECDVVSSFSEILLKQQFASSQLSIWSLHPIYHHIHCAIITGPLLFFQRHQWALRWFLASEYCLKNGDYSCLSKGAGKAWLHRWCDDVPSNPSELQKENDLLQQFSSSLVTYLFIIILNMLSLLWDRLVIPRSTRVSFDSIIFHVRHIGLKSRQVIPLGILNPASFKD
jgi:hypothetical protein